jgi:hypothetical protein
MKLVFINFIGYEVSWDSLRNFINRYKQYHTEVSLRVELFLHGLISIGCTNRNIWFPTTLNALEVYHPTIYTV